MEVLKKPILRVPLVLAALGLACRLLDYAGGFLWGLILRAKGPDPATGTITVTAGPTTAIVSAVSFLLFWWAGWRFVRGLSRREIFRSATIMVLVYAALLAAEQITQSVGVGFLTVYRLYALADGKGWVDQLLFRLFGTVSVPLVIPGLFAPYLYLVFAKKDVPQ